MLRIPASWENPRPSALTTTLSSSFSNCSSPGLESEVLASRDLWIDRSREMRMVLRERRTSSSKPIDATRDSMVSSAMVLLDQVVWEKEQGGVLKDGLFQEGIVEV